EAERRNKDKSGFYRFDKRYQRYLYRATNNQNTVQNSQYSRLLAENSRLRMTFGPTGDEEEIFLTIIFKSFQKQLIQHSAFLEVFNIFADFKPRLTRLLTPYLPAYLLLAFFDIMMKQIMQKIKLVALFTSVHIVFKDTASYGLFLRHIFCHEFTKILLVVPGILQHESPVDRILNGYNKNNNSLKCQPTFQKSLDDLLELLNFLHTKFRTYGADSIFLGQIFGQIIYWICALVLNHLMFRKELCNVKNFQKFRLTLLISIQFALAKDCNDSFIMAFLPLLLAFLFFL
ncbi:unnamed protein product, partial [Dracunculus medinensis]|uniref:Dilute domain-containing protein n=1 Tax=Dracunculus medinensis TaxID=318479 RepID=A0A0N4UH79_DRAME